MNRDAAEKSFFGKKFKDIPEDCKGIDVLRSRLSDLIYGRLKSSLPNVLSRVDKRYLTVIADLKKLGDPRSDLADQRKLLITVAMRYNNIVRNAVNGAYDDKFFDSTISSSVSAKTRHLRGRVSELQEQFMLQMQKYGHKFRIEESHNGAGTPSTYASDSQLREDYKKPKGFQQQMTRDAAVTWVREKHSETRGDELQGNFNTRLVSALFQEQSKPWEELAKEHLVKVDAAVAEFVNSAVLAAAGEKNLARNLVEHLQDVMEARFEKGLQELSNLVKDQMASIRIFDPAYAAEVQT